LTRAGRGEVGDTARLASCARSASRRRLRERGRHGGHLRQRERLVQASTTGEVKECGGGVYPGVQIRRRACGKALIGVGYTEVEKCKMAAAGAPCVTDDEIARAEAEEKKCN
jgi:hypothetical protein